MVASMETTNSTSAVHSDQRRQARRQRIGRVFSRAGVRRLGEDHHIARQMRKRRRQREIRLPVRQTHVNHLRGAGIDTDIAGGVAQGVAGQQDAGQQHQPALGHRPVDNRVHDATREIAECG